MPSSTTEQEPEHSWSDTRGPDDALRVIVPNRWQGESDCLVGPFSGHAVASYFANRLVDFGQFEVFSMRVFPKRNAWYVEVRARAAGVRVARGPR